MERRSGMHFVAEARRGDFLRVLEPDRVMVLNPDHAPRVIENDGRVIDLDPNAGIPTG